ncbi:MAG: hypothetical protein MI923_15590, partial [Phycisphaerales bacterium]|nr:hypothetical protein [Phycisphaerales bacterium]
TVDFNGMITANTGGATAVNLINNAGGTINFDGGLDIDATSGTGISATGGGTLNVTGTSNTIDTTTGRGARIENTTIGASGVTFQSISSDGGSNLGIALFNTGSGNFTVAGTGADGSGGTIQNKTGNGASFINAANISLSDMNFTDCATANGPGPCGTNVTGNTGCNAAIFLQNVTGVMLDNINTLRGQYGINGNNVTTFSLIDSNIASHGDEVEEDGVRFFNLHGTCAITDTTIRDSEMNNVRVFNNATAALTLTVMGTTAPVSLSDSAISNADRNDGILFEGAGGTDMTLNVMDTRFADSDGDHIQAVVNLTDTMDVNITGCVTDGGPGVLGSGFTLSSGAGFIGTMTFDILNNDIQNAANKAINVNIGTNSTSNGMFSGTISGNTIGTVGIMDSGGAGMDISANGAGNINATITNNFIRQYDSDHGLRIIARDCNGCGGTINATVSGNTLSNPEPNGFNGLLVQAGAASGDRHIICADIDNNTLTGSGENGSASASDFRLRQRFDTTINLPGYAGAANNTTTVVTFVQGNNIGTPSGSATVQTNGFTGNGTTCP